MFFCASLMPMPVTIMIDPAGHAQQTGRKLWSSFERAETLKCAEALKAAFEKYADSVRIILTRVPGQEIVSLQNASFANRLPEVREGGFFLRLQCYKEDAEKPQIFIHYLELDPLIDKAQHLDQPHAFVPINQAHFHNIRRSSEIAHALKNFLESNDYPKNFDCHGAYGLPLSPLMGIMAPAILVEIGLCADNQWQLFVDPLVQGLCAALSITKERT